MEYGRLYRAVLSVLVERDPLALADPQISLFDEYEAEAREIARRAVGASGDKDSLRTLIQDVFVQQFEARISDEDLEALVRVSIEHLHTSASDRTAEDPIRREFLEGFFRERAEEPVGAQLRFAGRKIRSWVKTLRDAGSDEGTEASWWAPVALAPEADALLDRAFEAAGPPIDHRVGLQVDLGSRGRGPDGGVEVRFDGTAVGVLRPAEIPTWGVIPQLGGTRRARLTRKRDAPRFLLEVDIG